MCRQSTRTTIIRHPRGSDREQGRTTWHKRGNDCASIQGIVGEFGEFLMYAALENLFEFDDGRIFLTPFRAGFDVDQSGFQDLDKMAGFRTAHWDEWNQCYRDGISMPAEPVTAVTAAWAAQ